MNSRNAIIAIAVSLTAWPCPSHAQDWNAGRDLKLNELSLDDLSNPNAAVPEWRYGYRDDPFEIALNLFEIPDHTNAFGGNPNIQGWALNSNLPALGVNVGSNTEYFNFGAGPVGPIDPEAIIMHPDNGQDVVVRWKTPFTGDFTLTVQWQDIDPYGGGGAMGLVLINGHEITSGVWPNGGGFTDANRVVHLEQDDNVDFVLDPNGDNGYDSTTFSATIVPEPGSVAAVLGGIGLLCLRRRMK